MKLEQHYMQHRCSDIEYGRKRVIYSILQDGEALRELEENAETWFDVDLRLVGGYCYDIVGLRNNEAPHLPHSVEKIMQHLGELVAEHWIRDVGSWVDARYADEDIAALEAAENLPEPDRDNVEREAS